MPSTPARSTATGDTAVRALDGVSVEIPAGRFTAVMGPSGSGKSTLMHCLAGLDDLTSGQVFVGDLELGSLSDAALTKVRRERLGFVFQSFNLLPTLTAEENILLPLRLAGARPDPAWVDGVIDTVGLRDRLGHRPSELSGGQQQRVAVARALASRPEVVFADEPTGNLDSRSGAEVLGLLRESVDRFGQTVVMVTHDPAAAAWADHALFLADGRIVDRIDEPTAALGARAHEEVRGVMGMVRLTLAAAWSRKRRLAGTVLAVVLGVAFLSATLVIGDSARAGFSTAFAEANAGTDALVRSSVDIEAADVVASSPIPASVADTVADVDGVAAVALSVEGVGQVLDAEGDAIGADGPPTRAEAWIEDPALTAWEVAEGREPTGPGEVVLDRASAETAGVAPGDQVTVLVPDPVDVEVVGIVTFGDDDSIGSTTFVAFELAEAQRLLLGSDDQVTGVIVAAADGVSQDELVRRLDPVLPSGTEAITGEALTAEMEADIESDFLGFFETALLIFAVVALLVATFTIVNTFSILVAQRTRESALLRAIGGSRRQVLVSAVAEAALVGVVAAAVGVGAGVLLAAGMLALMESAGFGMPTDGVALQAASLLTAFLVGLAVTVAGGLVPAWRASRVAPLAALREVAYESPRINRARVVAGLVSVAGGAALVLSGSSGEGGMSRAGMGSLVLVAGVLLLGPAAAGPIGRLLGAPLRLRGVSGDLAGRNAVRNPRRTAGTAASLLIGVAVVSLFTVFGASVTETIEREVERSFGADLVVQPASWGGAGISPNTVDDILALDEVETAAGAGFGAATIDGVVRELSFTDPAAHVRGARHGGRRRGHGHGGDLGPGHVGGVRRRARLRHRRRGRGRLRRRQRDNHARSRSCTTTRRGPATSWCRSTCGRRTTRRRRTSRSSSRPPTAPRSTTPRRRSSRSRPRPGRPRCSTGTGSSSPRPPSSTPCWP